MADDQSNSHHTPCLHSHMYHPVSTNSGCLLTAAPVNVLGDTKHLQGTQHAVIPVIQPTVVAQLDPRVLIEHRDGQFITIPTFELQPIPQANINEKIAIYRHPLFPLLRILFEKCELSTSYVDLMNAGSFDDEIKEFITQMAKDNKPFFTDDAEVDSLMLKSLQVLRIHLLELEKVNELCKDFCSRYISCLKGKLNSDNVMKTLDVNVSPVPSPSPITQETNNNIEDSSSPLESSDNISPTTSQTVEDNNNENLSCTETGQTTSENSVIAESINELASGFLSKKSKGTKRGVLPKAATTVLKGWLFQHLMHPYPTEDEKRELAQQTNLSNLQVNNWFINARRRILQPMLESSNSFLKTNKKSKQQRNAAQKDWTNTIGVYNAYRTEALQNTISETNTNISTSVQSMAWVPSNPPMLVSVPNNRITSTRHSNHSAETAQFVQVPAQLPLQTSCGITATHIPTASTSHTTTRQNSCEQTIHVPIYSQSLEVPVTQK